ncbi:hypothetical protein [Photobacterium ganghwense]|uniref:hypothetical protein n=1 Tax=Photobacterium ganghwense TaxID=320778 RepID=UPI001A8DB837|nr:hypothetical protein [Photobacterium ganghwense]QSV17649.1 hypothetical protein FH974_25525 [Photobacterium ganghwense]
MANQSLFRQELPNRLKLLKEKFEAADPTRELSHQEQRELGFLLLESSRSNAALYFFNQLIEEY